MAVHVTKHKDGGWQVIVGNSKRAYRVVKTQSEAIEIANTLSKNQNIDKRVHGKDGKIRKTSYSNDLKIEKTKREIKREEKLKAKLAKEEKKQAKLKAKLEKIKLKQKNKALKKQEKESKKKQAKKK